MNDGQRPNVTTVPTANPSAGVASAFLTAGGEMAALISAKDWAATALGAQITWPQSLQTVLRILVTSRYAMWLGWGPQLTFFYNDAYAAMTLGAKHPWALGRPASEVWAEIWNDIGPRAETVIRTGEATWDEGLLLFLERNGYPEETYHTFSYSPLPDDRGDVGGMLCVVTEDTDRVIGERRLGTLRELASLLAAVRTEPDVLAAIERGLATNARDIPFAIVWLFDAEGQRARLASRPASRANIVWQRRRSTLPTWPRIMAGARILGGLSHATIDDLGRFLARFLPAGGISRLVRPLRCRSFSRAKADLPACCSGLNPFRPLERATSALSIWLRRRSLPDSPARAPMRPSANARRRWPRSMRRRPHSSPMSVMSSARR